MRQYELEELAGIYEGRGLPRDLAHQVATHLTKNDGAPPQPPHLPPASFRLSLQ